MSSFMGLNFPTLGDWGMMMMQDYWNKKSQKRQNEYNLYMSSTAHQREVADLKAAGLNPVLSASGGAGAPMGSVGMSGVSALGGDGSASSVINTLLRKEGDKADAEIENLVAQAQSARENAAANSASAEAALINARSNSAYQVGKLLNENKVADSTVGLNSSQAVHQQAQADALLGKIAKSKNQGELWQWLANNGQARQVLLSQESTGDLAKLAHSTLTGVIASGNEAVQKLGGTVNSAETVWDRLKRMAKDPLGIERMKEKWKEYEEKRLSKKYGRPVRLQGN